ncbi:universal stress protein [Halorubrum tibetense]|uniref:Universal stress protein n=1 Tax=Halorubrum tibetense TaxID=175631 RepID=A0ABD5SCG7_9EURY
MTNTNTPTADEQPENDGIEQQEGAERPTVLVPLEVLEGDSMPDGTSELLANAHVVLLGYHVIPEQTAAEQAREQFGETAMKKLSEFADRLTTAGATVETRLVFTHGEQATIDRIIYEHDCLAVLVPNSIEKPESVLVAVRGTVGIGRNTQLIAGLFAGTDIQVTLYHVLGPKEEADDAQTLLNGVEADLVERGMDPDAIDILVEETETPIDAIARNGREHDAVVMGETDRSVTTFVFGMPSKQVAERFLGPVLVVQRERAAEGGDGPD